MNNLENISNEQWIAEGEVRKFKDELGPFVVAADKTRIPMLFTNAKSSEHEIVYANKSLLDLFDYSESDVLGLPFSCLLALEGDRKLMTPDAVAETQRSTVDLVCLRRDRSEFDGSVLSSPVCNEDGQIEQYFISIFDLTVPIERRMQDYLREAEIYTHAPGFIAFSNGPEHRFAFANSAYETLVGRQNLVGLRVAEAFPELADQGVVSLLDKVFKSGERAVGWNAPIHLTRGAEGSRETRYINFVYEPVRDSSGTVVGLFCEGSDITEARLITEKLDETQAQLMHISRMNAMGAMAATLAHEINQPLAAIANYASGCVHILEQDGVSSERLLDGLTAIAAASDRAGKIISRLREMTRRTTPIREVFDLHIALEESAHLVRAGGCEDVTIRVEGSDAVLTTGDKIQVQQVLVNLLRNACHAAAETGADGAVIAQVARQDGLPWVSVQDNGPGLPEEMIADPFKWVESSKPEGMGIGLSISRTIIEGHGGSLTLTQTGPSGTIFSFTLPRGG